MDSKSGMAIFLTSLTEIYIIQVCDVLFGLYSWYLDYIWFSDSYKQYR
jgi:hypothetical protein